VASSDGAAMCDALNASCAELAVLSRDINQMTRLLRQGSVEAARAYAARMKRSTPMFDGIWRWRTWRTPRAATIRLAKRIADFVKDMSMMTRTIAVPQFSRTGSASPWAEGASRLVSMFRFRPSKHAAVLQLTKPSPFRNGPRPAGSPSSAAPNASRCVC